MNSAARRDTCYKGHRLENVMYYMYSNLTSKYDATFAHPTNHQSIGDSIENVDRDDMMILYYHHIYRFPLLFFPIFVSV